MPKQIQYIKNGQVIAQLDVNNTLSIPDHDSTNEVWIVPEAVTLWQLRSVLKVQNLYSGVTTAIANLPEPTKTVATEAFEYANTILRTSPTIAFIQQALNLTSEQVDNLFIAAEQIEA